MDRIIQMIINTIMRQLINRGISAGINHVAKRGKSDDQMTPDDHQQAQDAKQIAKRARQAANAARRLGR